MHIASSNKCAIAFGVAFCTAGNLVPADDCGSTPARFDGVGSLHYATVAGDAGSRIYLHPQISNSCISGDAPQACDADAHGYLLPGNEVAVGKTCGAWSNVQYIGEKTVSYGWVAARSLQPSPGRSAAELPGQVHYRFALKSGGGTPVCEAYLQWSGAPLARAAGTRR